MIIDGTKLVLEEQCALLCHTVLAEKKGVTMDSTLILVEEHCANGRHTISSLAERTE